MSLLETLYNKRFGLCSNFVFEPNETPAIHYCLCGNYNHIACIFLGRGENLLSGKKIQVLSYGMNQYADVDGKEPSIHAEYDAISNLPPLDRRKSRNLYRCNIFVTKFSRSNNIGNSKPCSECIQQMILLPGLKGYQIKNVYYTNNEKRIVRERLAHLVRDNVPYYTRYQRTQKSSSVII